MDTSGITVIIRTPNQKVRDINIELSSASTIKELKRKIECDHPGSPDATQQKLIYDGRLLNDNHRIDSVIKESNRVVHLVYVCDDPDPQKVDTTPGAATLPAQTELRHRFTSQGITPGQLHSPHDNGAYSQAYADWLQQYQQHYSNYMQYYTTQNPYFAMAPTVQPVATEDGLNIANQPAAGAQEPEQQNIDGGFVAADDNAQDWLDIVFALTRFMLMLSIIYFYSTTYRFIIAVSVLLIIYLYQAGYFEVNRRPGRAPEANENVPQQQPTDDNNNNDDESSYDESGEHEVPPPPSIYATAICFVRTFFSSLVPTGPPGVVN